VVRWNNYHKELGLYQGELVGKGEVMKEFLSLSHPIANYDFSKISAVVDMIVGECTSMREAAQLAQLELEFPDDEE
jgi:hypothetical protein